MYGSRPLSLSEGVGGRGVRAKWDMNVSVFKRLVCLLGRGKACMCVCVSETPWYCPFRRVGVQLWFHCLPLSIIVSSPWVLLTGSFPSPLLTCILSPTSTLASHRKRPKESMWALRKWRKCQSWPTDTHLCLVSPWEMFEGLLYSVIVTHRNREKNRGLSVKTWPNRAISQYWPFSNLSWSGQKVSWELSVSRMTQT